MTELTKIKADIPFQPEPGESHAAFGAFLCYLDIGANRSCGEVARRMNVSASAARRWSGKFKWKERMAAYHAHLLRARVDVEMAATKDVAALWATRTQTFKEREWQAAEKLLQVAQAVLDSFAGRDPADISLSEVSKALEVASKIGRLATGLATEKQEHSGADGGPIRVEIEAALNKIYGKPIPGEVAAPPTYVDVQVEPSQPMLTEGKP